MPAGSPWVRRRVKTLAVILACCFLEASVGFCGSTPPSGGVVRKPWEAWATKARTQLGRLQAAASAASQEMLGDGAINSNAKLVSRLINFGPVPPSKREFLINGWRWHSLSVIRDLGRLRQVAEREQQGLASPSMPSALLACYDFVWTFSGVALQRIEGELFYPWLRQTLPPEARPLLDSLEAQRAKVSSLGVDLGVACRAVQGSDRPRHVQRVLQLATELESKTRELVACQEALVVPLVAAYVKPNDQKRFNNRVISRLGLLDSRLHLVCMSEAVRGNSAEEAKFRAQIPSVAQMMIPRWRDKLYLPRASCLEAASRANHRTAATA